MLFRSSAVALFVCLAASNASANANSNSVAQMMRKLQTQPITDIIADTANLSTLSTAITTADMTDALSTLTLTTLAPTDDAFAALDPTYLNLLLTPGWRLHLTELLEYHVTNSQAFSVALPDGFEITMLNDEIVTVAKDAATGAIQFLNSQSEAVNVIQADIRASNGLVHIVDGVLKPSFFYRTVIDLFGNTYSTISNLALLSGLESVIRDGVLTLLAPTNAAFNELPSSTISRLSSPDGTEELTSLILYHAINAVVPTFFLADGVTVSSAEGTPLMFGVQGDAITVNGANIVEPNILAFNGITHGLDKVMAFPSDEIPTNAPAPEGGGGGGGVDNGGGGGQTPNEDPTLYDLLLADQDLSTLRTAVDSAALSQALNNEGSSLTIMAPKNSAFEALPAGILDRLLSAAFSVHLSELLLYHISDEVLPSTDLVNGKTIPTRIGEIVIFTVDENGAGFFNEAGITAIDSLASNGVLHTIAGVLLPSFASRTVVDLGAAYSTLLTVIELAELKDTLMTGIFTLFAPTNEAFAKLPQEAVNFLTSTAGRTDLIELLSYHASATVLTANKLMDGMQVVSLLADAAPLAIGIDGMNVMVNGEASLVTPDILALNGVTHGIDTVLTLTMDRDGAGDGDDPSPPEVSSSSSIGASVLSVAAVVAAFALF